ncbi:hypothetical protein THC_0234 [Caldimicrobium thiodismutans]|uniref:Uncharacterized protein n=1 Tax=Caldimicrobium thiodismutans TaxID=1653476 RepID=A0A0U4W0D1_9BACT|nr:hypothetical protein THC_0234 [Caldimicrobium thiodismutans]
MHKFRSLKEKGRVVKGEKGERVRNGKSWKKRFSLSLKRYGCLYRDLDFMLNINKINFGVIQLWSLKNLLRLVITNGKFLRPGR